MLLHAWGYSYLVLLEGQITQRHPPPYVEYINYLLREECDMQDTFTVSEGSVYSKIKLGGSSRVASIN